MYRVVRTSDADRPFQVERYRSFLWWGSWEPVTEPDIDPLGFEHHWTLTFRTLEEAKEYIRKQENSDSREVVWP